MDLDQLEIQLGQGWAPISHWFLSCFNLLFAVDTRNYFFVLLWFSLLVTQILHLSFKVNKFLVLCHKGANGSNKMIYVYAAKFKSDFYILVQVNLDCS